MPGPCSCSPSSPPWRRRRVGGPRPPDRPHGPRAALLARPRGVRAQGGDVPAARVAALGARGAPSHVSALMSGVAMRDLGVYGLVRFSGWLPVPEAAGFVVIGLGAASALFGIAFAFVQSDVKRLLAYCSVENVGVILVGLGAALLARAHGDAPVGPARALTGALLHVLGVTRRVQGAAVLGAGAVLHATGARGGRSRLGGLWRGCPGRPRCSWSGPWRCGGLPPLNGFVSEWMVYLGCSAPPRAGTRPRGRPCRRRSRWR